MRLDLTIHYDTLTELRAQLDAIINLLPSVPVNGFNLGISPSMSQKELGSALMQASWGLGAQDSTLANAPAPAPEAEPEPEAEAPKRTRTRRPAAETKAPEPEPDPEEQAPAVEDDQDDNPLADDETVPEDPSTAMSPAEAKLAALKVLAQAYALPNGPPAVKQVQTAYGVKKFAEVPDAKGLDLLRDAEAALAKLQAQTKAA